MWVIALIELKCFSGSWEMTRNNSIKKKSLKILISTVQRSKQMIWYKIISMVSILYRVIRKTNRVTFNAEESANQESSKEHARQMVLQI